MASRGECEAKDLRDNDRTEPLIEILILGVETSVSKWSADGGWTGGSWTDGGWRGDGWTDGGWKNGGVKNGCVKNGGWTDGG